MLEELLGETVVIDLRSLFVCLGTLLRVGEHYLELGDADLHDLRDSPTNRENYVAASRRSEIIRNRRKVLILRCEVIAIARLHDVVSE